MLHQFFGFWFNLISSSMLPVGYSDFGICIQFPKSSILKYCVFLHLQNICKVVEQRKRLMCIALGFWYSKYWVENDLLMHHSLRRASTLLAGYISSSTIVYTAFIYNLRIVRDGFILKIISVHLNFTSSYCMRTHTACHNALVLFIPLEMEKCPSALSVFKLVSLLSVKK